MAIEPNQRILDWIDKCASSREARRAAYATRRLWMMRGTDSAGPAARFNRLKAHLKTLTSYLYAPEGTRFAVKVPAADRHEYMDHLGMARDAFVDIWRDSGTDVVFEQFVTWALVNSMSIAKVLPDPAFHAVPSYVFPGDFGVLREDAPGLDRQEVFCHWYHLTMGEVATLVEPLPEENRAEILSWAEQNASPEAAGSGMLPSMLQQVIITNTTGDFFGSSQRGSLDIGTFGIDVPDVKEPLVECCEVWERRDFKTKEGTKYIDYWVTTVIGNWPIIERRNPVLPYIDQPLGPSLQAENPFVTITPNPLLDYFWGSSELLPLIPLQQWREERMSQIDKIFALGLEPSIFFSGMPGLSDEKVSAMRKPGGYLSSPQPGAKMDVLKPELPAEAFQILSQIDQMFADQSGMQGILEGKEQAGVRAGNQLGAMAGIAAGGRIRDQALIVEDALEVLATRMFHLVQRADDTAYPLPDGKHFLLAQLPQPVTVRVSAHSASPVYAEQVLAKAQLLRQANAIDLPTFVDLVDPPHRQDLVDRARDLEKNQADQAQAVFELKKKEVELKGRPKG